MANQKSGRCESSAITGTVSIPLNCGSCGGAMTLQLVEFGRGVPLQPTSYTCPWCGDAETRYRIGGRLVWVAAGHEPGQPNRH